ncbi:hypothetical protein Gogos_019303 [Gossypium gossypioides]|uniref:Zinc knuckle CX2CX4HX4C domain-containing protein n=1 Tax=Gossypium gossypioides TaxID=34282 RepID=A0A7J9BGY9_GOSGO|nr:hypothetical protein [Gossypium gossypioides]
MRIRVQIDVRNLLMRKKKLILSNKGCIYARFQYEKLSVFCFLCGRLRHSERFYPARIVHGKTELEFEWDLSVKTIPKRVMVVTSSWLGEKGEGPWFEY